jgi:hypothetical protein
VDDTRLRGVNNLVVLDNRGLMDDFAVFDNSRLLNSLIIRLVVVMSQGASVDYTVIGMDAGAIHNYFNG